MLDYSWVEFGKLPNFVRDGDFTTFTTQSGAPVDTPKTILFGSTPSTSPSGVVGYDGAGVFTFLKAGPILTKTRIRAGRTGSTGTSILFFYTEISFNGGTNWFVLGNSSVITLDVATEAQTLFDFGALTGVVGVKIRQRFARSSTGNDSGDLLALSPSGPLVSAGVPTVPAAQQTIYTLSNYAYV